MPLNWSKEVMCLDFIIKDKILDQNLIEIFENKSIYHKQSLKSNKKK